VVPVSVVGMDHLAPPPRADGPVDPARGVGAGAAVGAEDRHAAVSMAAGDGLPAAPRDADAVAAGGGSAAVLEDAVAVPQDAVGAWAALGAAARAVVGAPLWRVPDEQLEPPRVQWRLGCAASRGSRAVF
jgi:hypothetical protein